MRADMAKVIVERPRVRSRPTRRGRPETLEELPACEGMRRRHVLRGDPKMLNENLAPLRRFLARQIGRPWDKVYSEISANLRVDSAVQQHVRDHLGDFVAVAPRRDISGRRSSHGGLWWQEFYVDSSTRLLCRTDRLPEEKKRTRARRALPREPIDRVALTDTRELRLIAGLWYAVELAPLPEPVYQAARETIMRPLVPYLRNSRCFEADIEVRRLSSAPVRDIVSGRLIAPGPASDDFEAWQAYRRTYPDRRYAIAKRVLSRRELRRHGLTNSV